MSSEPVSVCWPIVGAWRACCWVSDLVIVGWIRTSFSFFSLLFEEYLGCCFFVVFCRVWGRVVSIGFLFVTLIMLVLWYNCWL
ncbi:hypothetical protein BDW42DRAFT_179021 [Aspergillus taichungensis]|uniref:Transmembrane protein n=1 Tax=Aspergillus taichungensis TaxID=482145 RepID=A0A2J5HHG3_9EURO|nr:hypothetical protein BDW42DRAFT_179021 [Aspergillus taichungensis]